MVDTWSKLASGHLSTVGRHDGLDLAGDRASWSSSRAQRASSELEWFVLAHLGDASLMRDRVAQALGRANREPTERARCRTLVRVHLKHRHVVWTVRPT